MVRAVNADDERIFFESLPLKYKAIWLVGKETGLRVSDILSLKVKQIRAEKFVVIEQKTKKRRECDISGLSADEKLVLKIQLQNLHDDGFAFYGRNPNKALTRIQVYRIFSAVAHRNGIKGIGTHSMRKTFAREHFMHFRDIEKLREVLNHKHTATTLGYIFDKSALATLKL
jgi:integrase